MKRLNLLASEIKGLTSDSLYSLAIKVAAILLSFAAVVAINRLATPAEFGAYMYALSIISLLRIVTIWGGERWLVREVASSAVADNFGIAQSLKNGVLVVAMSISVIMALILYIATKWAPWVFNDDALEVVKYSWLLLPLMTLVTVYQAYVRGLHRSVIAQIPDALIRPALMIVGLFVVGFLAINNLSATEIMSLQTTSTFLALLVLGWVSYSITNNFKRNNDVTEVFQYRDFLHAGVTLVFIALVIRGSSFVITILLGNLATVTDVALFTVSKRISDLVTFMQAAIVMPLAPMIAKKFKQGNRQALMRLAVAASWGSFLFALPVSVVLVCFPEFILSIFGSDYKDAVSVLQIMVITQLITVSLGPVTVWLTMTKNDGAAIKAAMIGFSTLVITAVVLIPDGGALGGAMAFSVGLVVTQLVMLAFVSRKVGIDSSVFGLRYFLFQRK